MPATLVYTLLSFAALGAAGACGSKESQGGSPSDAAAIDAQRDASQDCTPTIGCAPVTSSASCPQLVCTFEECSPDAGCEPFV